MKGSKLGWRMAWSGCFCVLLIELGVLHAQKAVIKNENGVIVIQNPVEPVPNRGRTKLVLKEELTIGLQEKEAGYHFEEISAIQADAQGNIFVLDLKACQIKKFSEAGKFFMSFGHKGQGPGEFGPPQGMHIIADREILVCSFGRLSYFDLDGVFLRQITALFWGAPVPISSGDFIAETNAPAGGPPKFANELRIYDSSLKAKALLYRHEFIMPSDSDVLNPFPAIAFYSVQADDTIIWGVTDRYLLTVTDRKGTVLKKILKDFLPLKITDTDKKSILKELAPNARHDFPANFPPFRHFHVDDEGRIFVRTYESYQEDNRHYDVFDKDGVFFAKIVLKSPPFQWRKGKMYSAVEDKDGLLQVKRYSVRWE